MRAPECDELYKNLSCEKNDCKMEYYYELYVVTMWDKITMIQKQEYSIVLIKT